MIKTSQSRAGMQMAGVILLLAILTGSCGDKAVNTGPIGPVTPATLPGKWKFVSAQSQTFTARSGQAAVTKDGEPTNEDIGERTTISGSFTLTSTRYNLTGTVNMTEPGQTPFNKTAQATGTYTVDGSKATIVDDASGRTTTLTVSQNGDQLTLIGSYAYAGVGPWGITAVFEKE